MSNDARDEPIPFPVLMVGGIPFRVATLERVCDWILDVAASKHLPLNIRLANAYNVALANQDEGYGRLLSQDGVNFPDGTPVVWFMNLARARHAANGTVVASRVRGPSLFQRVLKASPRSGARHFLLGGSPGALAVLNEQLPVKYPGLLICGSYSPPYEPVSEEYILDCAARIQVAMPDLIWIGLGTPKQDVVGTELSKLTGLTTINVGAAFDFAAGTAREAPVWIQNSGFEWAFRLATEPSRLWRRYLIGNFHFLVAALTAGGRATRSGGSSRNDNVGEGAQEL